jgi:hypothetical protein
VQTPESYEPFETETAARPPLRPPVAARPRGASLWETGRRMTWVAGLVLAVSAFTGWYVGSGDGVSLSVVGWNTGTLGKLVFFVGLVVVALVALREAGIELPATVPESLVVIGLGSLGTIFVLIRLIQPPDEFLPADGRGIGLWISLVAAVAVIVAGLLQASEEL